MLVDAIMTRAVVTVKPEASLHAAAGLLREGRFRHLPVVRDGRLMGIVSDREVIVGVTTPVGEVMHRDVITISPDTPVEIAATLMADNKIGAIPVVDPLTAALVGIISQTDLFVALAHLLGGNAPGTRLELHLSDLPRQLAVMADAASRHHIRLSNLVVVPARHNQLAEYTAVLHVETIDPRQFVADLRQAGIDVF